MIEPNETGHAAAVQTGRQVRALAALDDGWLDGYGRALPASWLDGTALALEREVAAGLPRPYVYPTPAGGLQLEWSAGSWDVSAEIAPGSDRYNLGATWYDHHQGVEDVEAEGLTLEGLRLAVAALIGGPALLGAAYAPAVAE